MSTVQRSLHGSRGDPRLDTLFLTLPVSWQGTLIQYAGRLHRLRPGKRDVRVFDYNPAVAIAHADQPAIQPRAWPAMYAARLASSPVVPGASTIAAIASAATWRIATMIAQPRTPATKRA